MINNSFLYFLFNFFCNVRASDAMPFFAITVILTCITGYYLEIMAKRSTNYPADYELAIEQPYYKNLFSFL